MDKKIIDQFKQEMDSAVKLWKVEEKALYDTFPEEIWTKDSWCISKPDKMEDFPDFIWEIWFSPLDGQDGRFFTPVYVDREKIKNTIMDWVSDKPNSTEKGLAFEKIGRDIRNDANSLIRYIGKEWLGSKDAFSHTGLEMHREDFEINKRYTIDFKYSELKDDSKYRNIIKTAGKPSYKNIGDLQDGIMRSLYSIGQMYGKGHIFDFEENSFKEIDKVTGSLVWKNHHSNDDLDPHRKILIYLFQDGGNWASKCLEYTIDWAIKELKSGSFDKLLQEKKYVPAKDFWKFTNYGNMTKDDEI